MKRLRTFIGIDLGKTVRDKAVALQESLARAGSDVKWVEPENLHVTLLFLGEVDDRDVPAVCRAVADCCHQHAPFRMSVETVGCFGNPRRPRTVWIGVGEGTQEVVALHDALFPSTRYGAMENAWFNLSYLPVRDDDGQIINAGCKVRKNLAHR